MIWPISNGLTSSASNATTSTWNTVSNSWYGGITSGTYTTNHSHTYNPVKVTIDIKRCRNCNHAHLAEQTGCIDLEGWNTVFVVCSCKEQVPSDNLEYLEWLDKKKNG
jgi:hypothetical protein